jgi:hypothetical protein
LVSDYIPSSQVIQHAMSLQKSRGITDDIQAASTRSIEPALAASK